eukprot:9985175-Alexandrium_andersonii.AAC.1
MLKVTGIAPAPGQIGSGVNEGFLSASAPLEPQVSASLLGLGALRLRLAPRHIARSATPELSRPSLPGLRDGSSPSFPLAP